MSLQAHLVNGTPQLVEINKAPPITVAVTPGSGCTVTVQFDLGGGNYYPWDAGPVTAPTIRVVRGPIRGVLFTRTVGSGTDSVGEVL